MRIIDFHTHLASPTLADPIVSSLRRAYDLFRPSLPAGARAAIELAATAALPVERRLRDRALGIADRALARSRNRAMYLGPIGEQLAKSSGDLLHASFYRASARNLLADMDEAGIAAAVVLPAPPSSTTEEVLSLCRSPRLIPFCCPEPGAGDLGARMARWKARGCRGVKIHPTLQGRPPSDRFYHEVAEAAQALELPIVAHTGEVEVGERPEHAAFSRATAYEPLLGAFPKVRFVLAHMNLFRSEEALEVALRHENVTLDTSWQPAGVIGRAVRRLGERRLVFATDWPFLGTHLSTALEVVADGLGRKPEALERVLYRNAEELLSPSW